MLMKLLLTIFVVVAAFTALRVFGGASSARVDQSEKAARKAVRRRMNSEELRRCEDCNAWVSPHETCACKTPVA